MPKPLGVDANRAGPPFPQLTEFRAIGSKTTPFEMKSYPGSQKCLLGVQIQSNIRETFQPIDIDRIFLYGKGVVLSNSGRYEEALQAYDKAIELKPDFSSAWLNKGNALGKLGRYEKALQTYDKVIELSPDDSNAWYNKGAVLSNLGRYEEALQAYDKVIELNPDDSNAWCNKGTALDNLGRYEEAHIAFKKASELKKESGEAKEDNNGHR